MKKWAVSLCAIHKAPRAIGGNDVSIRHSALVVEATTQDEALGKGWRYVFARFPSDKNWSMHHVTVCGTEDADVAVPVEQVEAEVI